MNINNSVRSPTTTHHKKSSVYEPKGARNATRPTFRAASAHKTNRSEETASILSSPACLSFLNLEWASSNAETSSSCDAAWRSFRILLSMFRINLQWSTPLISRFLPILGNFSWNRSPSWILQHSRYSNEKRGSFDFLHVIQVGRGSLEPSWVRGNFSCMNFNGLVWSFCCVGRTGMIWF